jgi:uncharacterized membrane protein SpoIIM required for sporulation
MLIDVRKFAETEQIYWEELEAILLRLERDPERHLNLTELRRFHYLYERASADLAKVTTFVAENEIRHYLESLVAKAYGEIHETREKPHKFAPIRWFLFTFPETFHRNIRQFYLSLICTLVGTAFGAIAIGFDPQAKEILLPFPHLQESPAERVAREEQRKFDPMAGHKTTFSAVLMTHNTQVSILALALGMTGGVGTILLLFYNGVILGAVSNDYAMAGQLKFLLGWLMPHGVIEIPAILIAGQAGFLIASALLGRGKRMSMRMRFREISADLVTLILGVSLLLVWAGIIESFLSQYHEPAIPYMLKIAFGVLELVLLILFLSRGARYTRPSEVRVTPIRNAAAP